MEQLGPGVLRTTPRRARATRSRKLQAWKDNEKWKTTNKWVENEKWRQDSNDDDIPKYASSPGVVVVLVSPMRYTTRCYTNIDIHIC